MVVKVYRCDIRIAGTAFVTATSVTKAKELVAKLYGNGFEVVEGKYGDVIFSGARLDDPKLPEVSLSPCFTIHDPWSPLEVAHEWRKWRDD